METVNAIVKFDHGMYEVRCGNCGKLLFKFEKNVDNFVDSVDNMQQNVIIVARCTRNDCKMDNTLNI